MAQNTPAQPARRPLDRRAFARGTAWVVPAVAVAAAAPAYAISGIKVTKTISANAGTGQVLSFSLPRTAHDISYTITGGGGGSYVGPFDGMAGSGAKITGTIKLNACGSNQTIWMMAGGGGDQPTTAGATTQATGYGNGGKAFNTPYPTSTGSEYAYQSSSGGGGGAGSAIAVGGAPTAGGTVLVVAGGGGGDGVWGNATSSAENNKLLKVITPTSKTLDPGGSASGGKGGDITTTYNPTNGTLKATGGAGATVGTGGVGGTGSTTIVPWNYVQTTAGKAGGNHGNGTFGGGNGADYVTNSHQQTINYSDGWNIDYSMGVASGAGGGGWAGGGSGGIEIVDSATLGPSTYYRRYSIAGAGGSGGAGTNYKATAVNCVANTVTFEGFAGNAGSNSTGTGAGGPGTVTITYYA